MPATLSLIGLINYNPLILDSLAAAMPTADIGLQVKTGLLAESAELEVLYPDAGTFKQIFDQWVAQRTPIWDKLYNTTLLVYDALHNYDRTETETIVHDSTEDSSASSNYNATRNVKQDTHDVTDTTDSTNRDSGRYGYNQTTSASPEARSAEQSTGHSKSDDLMGMDETGGSDGSSTGHLEKAGQETRTVHAFGNIGTTTSDELIAAYRGTQQFDFVEYVIQDVIGRFCLLVY